MSLCQILPSRFVSFIASHPSNDFEDPDEAHANEQLGVRQEPGSGSYDCQKC